MQQSLAAWGSTPRVRNDIPLLSLVLIRHLFIDIVLPPLSNPCFKASTAANNASTNALHAGLYMFDLGFIQRWPWLADSSPRSPPYPPTTTPYMRTWCTPHIQLALMGAQQSQAVRGSTPRVRNNIQIPFLCFHSKFLFIHSFICILRFLRSHKIIPSSPGFLELPFLRLPLVSFIQTSPRHRLALRSALILTR
jgi:hypothetical protein